MIASATEYKADFVGGGSYIIPHRLAPTVTALRCHSSSYAAGTLDSSAHFATGSCWMLADGSNVASTSVPVRTTMPR